MTTNKPGSIGQRPLYGCTSCYEDYSWPADDLRVYENECWCEICWDETTCDFMDQPSWGELDTFTPRPACSSPAAGRGGRMIKWLKQMFCKHEASPYRALNSNTVLCRKCWKELE